MNFGPQHEFQLSMLGRVTLVQEKIAKAGHLLDQLRKTAQPTADEVADAAAEGIALSAVGQAAKQLALRDVSVIYAHADEARWILRWVQSVGGMNNPFLQTEYMYGIEAAAFDVINDAEEWFKKLGGTDRLKNKPEVR